MPSDGYGRIQKLMDRALQKEIHSYTSHEDLKFKLLLNVVEENIRDLVHWTQKGPYLFGNLEVGNLTLFCPFRMELPKRGWVTKRSSATLAVPVVDRGARRARGPYRLYTKLYIAGAHTPTLIEEGETISVNCARYKRAA